MDKTAELTVYQQTIIQVVDMNPLLNWKWCQKRLSMAKERKEWAVAQWS